MIEWEKPTSNLLTIDKSTILQQKQNRELERVLFLADTLNNCDFKIQNTWIIFSWF